MTTAILDCFQVSFVRFAIFVDVMVEVINGAHWTFRLFGIHIRRVLESGWWRNRGACRFIIFVDAFQNRIIGRPCIFAFYWSRCWRCCWCCYGACCDRLRNIFHILVRFRRGRGFSVNWRFLTVIYIRDTFGFIRKWLQRNRYLETENEKKNLRFAVCCLWNWQINNKNLIFISDTWLFKEKKTLSVKLRKGLKIQFRCFFLCCWKMNFIRERTSFQNDFKCKYIQAINIFVVFYCWCLQRDWKKFSCTFFFTFEAQTSFFLNCRLTRRRWENCRNHLKIVAFESMLKIISISQYTGSSWVLSETWSASIKKPL